MISRELRSSPQSIESRLTSLSVLKCIDSEGASPRKFRYNSRSNKESLISSLLDEYKVRKGAVLELVFSPLKQGRHFADAFVLSGPTKVKGDSDG